ncbi:MAG TPA: AAC(3)-I family aminoglycoside N-acetyltransferase [Candidatus Saccharimonadales bacterium]|nr:AAC(3)-I family aminoglycoside N-acetyltransferase [Candidatus Saccharimonadales bacterium]
MTYHYRRLGSDDLQPMRDLLGVFAEAFGEPNTYLAAPPRDSYFRCLLSQDHFIALIAVKEEQVVGGLTAYVLYKFEQQRSEIYIYDLAVAKTHRRRGIATALIQCLQDLAKSCQAWVIFVQADPDDEPAMNLYASLGNRETVYHFDIPVERSLKSTGRKSQTQSGGSIC